MSIEIKNKRVFTSEINPSANRSAPKKEIAKLMNQSRFAIITPSVIVHEVLFMDILFLAIKTADNQDDIYTYLKQKNYKVFENFEKWYNEQEKGAIW